MGNIQAECTPILAAAAQPSSALPKECCTPELCSPGVDALDDRECADILLVNGTIRGDLEVVRRALDLGASPNTIAGLTLKMGEPAKSKRKKGIAHNVTPIMRACYMGNEDIVIALLQAKASPVCCDSHGWSPLCHALGAGEVALAGRLVEILEGQQRAEAQRTIAVKLRNEILERCTEDAGQEAAHRVSKAFDMPSGFLSMQGKAVPGG